MFFPRINVKDDPVRRWHRPDRQFFANGACHILAYAFLERHADLGFQAQWIRPAAGYIGHHIFVSDGRHAFDYHGLTTMERLLALCHRRAGRRFPGWNATLVELPAEALVSRHHSRRFDGLWLRELEQFLHNAMPRGRAFLDRFGDLRSHLAASALSD